MKEHETASRKRYVELDGLRALSVASVFLFHITPALTSITHIGWDPSIAVGSYAIRPPLMAADYIVHLNIGVQIFFVLSGFLITSMFVRPHLANGALPSGISYAARRAARVLPAYWLVLVVAGVTWFGMVETANGARLPMLRFPMPFGIWKHISLSYLYFREQFVPGFGVNYGGLGVSWSLVVEVTFYAFVPCWLLVAKRLRIANSPRRLLVSALLCIPIGITCGVIASYAGEWAMRTPVGGLVSVFGSALISLGIGMALAVVVASARQDQELAARLRRLGKRAGLCWIVAAVVYVALAWPESRYISATSGELLWRQLVQPVIAGLLVAPFVFAPGERTLLHRAMRLRALVWVGTVSYGVYLWHMIIINRLVVGRSLDDYNVIEAAALVAAMWFVTVVVASLSFYLVERPLLGLVGRLGSRSNAVVVDGP